MPTGVYVRTKEYREKMSVAMKGHITTEETRRKISVANKGTKPAPHTIEASVRARKGKPLTALQLRSITRFGSDNHKWKGDDASYAAIHIWVNNNIVDPGKCQECNTEKNLQWSNKNHKYARLKDDWQRLCAKCHYAYDKRTGIRKARNTLPVTVNGLA